MLFDICVFLYNSTTRIIENFHYERERSEKKCHFVIMITDSMYTCRIPSVRCVPIGVNCAKTFCIFRIRCPYGLSPSRRIPSLLRTIILWQNIEWWRVGIRCFSFLCCPVLALTWFSGIAQICNTRQKNANGYR